MISALVHLLAATALLSTDVKQPPKKMEPIEIVVTQSLPEPGAPAKVEPQKQKLVRKTQQLNPAPVEPTHVVIQPSQNEPQPPSKISESIQLPAASVNTVKAVQTQTANIARPISQAHQSRDELKLYFSKLRKKVEDGLVYPSTAKRMGMEGKVVVCFCVTNEGILKERSVRVVNSSGSAWLDSAAIAAVKDAAPFEKPPTNEAMLELVLPVEFNLQKT